MRSATPRAWRSFEEWFLVDLLTAGDQCVGAIAISPETRRPEVFWADAVVLATGGCGQVFRVTTNPAIATGDGVAAAWRAGAEIADMEFVQFHPTALDSDASPKFLITEALRGEGAYLLDCDHERFMVGVHPLAELAPRDVVTRHIEGVMARCGQPFVWLDARHLGAEYLSARFPTIWETCLEAGYDLSTDLIPVAPAAHYMIGGVRVDIDGRTSVPGLYAAGEVTASGLHGANRLASNSLLEGLVFSRRIVRQLATGKPPMRPARVVSGPSESAAAFTFERGKETLQETMSTFVGMSRSSGSLGEAAHIVGGLCRLLDVSLSRPQELELQNLVTTAALLTHAAWVREESRGTHRRTDFPARDDERWGGHVLWQRGSAPELDLSGGGLRRDAGRRRPVERSGSDPCRRPRRERVMYSLPRIDDLVASALAEDLGVPPEGLLGGALGPELLERDVTTAAVIARRRDVPGCRRGS